jgi:thioredoxin 1
MSEHKQVREVDIFQLDELINSGETIVVDYWAPWCNPCLAFAKVFEKIAEEESTSQIKFVKMNIQDANEEVLESLGIRSVPHLMIFKQGMAVFSESGSMPYAVLRDLVEQTKKLEVNN